jgi:hypothetical protein
LFLLNSAFRILVQPLHFDPSTTAVAGQTRKRANPNNAPKPLPSLLRKGTYRAVLSSKFIETMWFQMPYHMLKYYWCEYTTVLYRPCKLTIYPGNHFATEDFNVFNASTKLITHLTECLKCVTSEPFQARAVSPKTSLLNFLPSPEFYSIILSWKKQQVSTNVHRHIACSDMGPEPRGSDCREQRFQPGSKICTSASCENVQNGDGTQPRTFPSS